MSDVDPHDLIRQQMESTGWSPELDERLALCTDPECAECGRIVCPTGEPMHFHHDGCPSCHAEGYAAMEREALLRCEVEQERRRDVYGLPTG